MPINKMPAQRAINFIDGTLLNELKLKRIDDVTRSKAHFFEAGDDGKQFAVLVGDADGKGVFQTQQTRILLEIPPPEISGIEPIPYSEFYNSSPVLRSFSRLAPPNQRSVLVESEAALRSLLEWYVGTKKEQLPKTPISQTPIAQLPLEVQPMQATNVILYGPPGTGKTYSTFARAVMTCDGKLPDDSSDESVLIRYEELRKERRISFVTFHQSYGYEEFVEGLRPKSNDLGHVSYNVIPGAFLQACDAARRRQLVKPGLTGKPLKERTIFKMSLGAKGNGEGVEVFQYGLENGCVLLGYGDEVDFSDCVNESEITAQMMKEAPDTKKIDSHAWSVNYFKNELKIGDLIVVSNGNKLFRAIAEVTGDYQFIENAPFHQTRAVKWLAVYESSRSINEIFDRDFAMSAIYKLQSIGLNYNRINELLSIEVETPSVKPHVIIIDEINRANISKVFGELITLLEPDKREGGRYPVTVKLPYSGHDFSVPGNLHVLGTMNTADRSIALLDTALRRRFDFDELMPDHTKLKNVIIDGINLEELLKVLNQRIEALYDRDHTIGHAFFLGIDTIEKLELIFRRKVLPLLQEYFYENWSNVRRVLNDLNDGDFILREKFAPLPSDSDDSYDDEPRTIYRVNKFPFPIDAYKRIYGAL